MMRGLRCLLAIVPIVVGCGGSDKEFRARSVPPFENEADVRTWAQSSSALSVFYHFQEPLAVADGHESYDDPACPLVSDDGTTLSITGDCTDVNDSLVSGRATVVRDGSERTITLEGWSGNADGTAVVRETGPSLNAFHADLSIGVATLIEYDGFVEGGYTGRTIWNGTGTVERRRDYPPSGVIQATTEDEVRDQDVCSRQPISGSTTLRTGDDTAVVTYDGATDCDEAWNARLSVNGDDRGLLSGILCTIDVPGKRDRAASFGIVLALATLFGVRRRRGLR
jgi:hypothetical protein